MNFEGKVAFITGGAGGIGGATAQTLLAKGARVIVTDLALAETTNSGLESIRLDVTDEHAWQSVVERVLGTYGRIDILVNAAGIEGNVLDSSPLCSFAEWKKVLSVNLDGTFLATKAILPGMLENDSGVIINLSSLAHYVGLPMTVPYAVSKSGVWNYSRAVAAYAASQGSKVRCNSVHPGLIDTRMLADIGSSLRKLNPSVPETDGAPPNVPLARLGTAQEVADLIAYLVSDEASYITGSEFRIDGGWGLWMNGKA